MPTREWKNLIGSLGNPLTALKTSLFIIQRLFFSLQYRYAKPSWKYPKAVRKAYRKVRQVPLNGFKIDQKNGSPESIRLRLARGWRSFSGYPHWNESFDDPEQELSLHRWHWLLIALSDAEQKIDTEWGLALMRSWLQTMGTNPQGLAAEPYTSGERIINAIIFLSRVEKVVPGENVPEDIRAALVREAVQLSHRIEYAGNKGTGNHVLNNARALFFAGASFGIAALTQLALQIVKQSLPVLITPEGFLREGSSHYHFLVTRWILEMLWLADNTHQQEMKQIFSRWGQRMIKCCHFFLVYNQIKEEWQIPLIGDVSPDCPPDWLLHLPWSHLAQDLVSPPSPAPELPLKGWARLWKAPREWTASEENAARFQDNPESGWLRIDHEDATLIWHIRSMVHQATHEHADTLGFTFFIKGVPILVDPGRPTYEPSNPDYSYSGSAAAHNAPTVDGLDPILVDKAQHLPQFYLRSQIKTKGCYEEEDFTLVLQHDGFRRLKKKGVGHERRFRVGKKSLEIVDTFEGSRQHEIRQHFHWDPEISLQASEKPSFQISHASNISATFSHVFPEGSDVQIYKAWISPAYGIKTPSTKLIAQVKRGLSSLWKTEIKWN